MEPCPPQAPPSPERGRGSPSPAALAPQPPPKLGRHLLIDGNGVPYMYTIRLEEEQPRREPKAPPGEAAKAYSCPECSQVFKNPDCLKRHGILHSDLRPYVCGLCARAFKWPTSLRQHLLTHGTRSKRRHACPLCPRRFLAPRELAQHLRGH